MTPIEKPLKPRALREMRIEGDAVYIVLKNGVETVVDLADMELVSGVSWFAKNARKTMYVEGSTRCVNYKMKKFYLHRFLMQPGKGVVVDHIDGDGLNNRRSNLRLVDKSQNAQNAKKSSANTSGFKGVSFNKATGKWEACLRAQGKKRFLGLHQTPELAHAAYCRGIEKHFGEFGRAV